MHEHPELKEKLEEWKRKKWKAIKEAIEEAIHQ